jgi:hypothetical protein
MNEAPEVWEECPDCHGEGGIEVCESVSKWSIDPPCAHVVFCKTCNGSGGMICEAVGDREWERDPGEDVNEAWARGEHIQGVTQ